MKKRSWTNLKWSPQDWVTDWTTSRALGMLPLFLGCIKRQRTLHSFQKKSKQEWMKISEKADRVDESCSFTDWITVLLEPDPLSQTTLVSTWRLLLGRPVAIWPLWGQNKKLSGRNLIFEDQTEARTFLGVNIRFHFQSLVPKLWRHQLSNYLGRRIVWEMGQLI